MPIDVAEALCPCLDGPADTGDTGIMAHERVAAVDGEVVESDDESEVHVNAAIADPEHPEEMMPAMHVCADELASADLDELQAIRKVRVELEQLQEAIRQDELAPISAVVPKKRIHALQRATQAMIVRSVAQKVQAAARSVEEVEKGSVVKNVSEFMYSPEAAAEAASSAEANAARDDEEDFGTRTVQVHPKCSLQYFDPDERNKVIIRWQQLGKYKDSQGRVWPCEMVAKQPEHPAVVLRDLNTKQQMYHIPNGTLVKVVGERDDEFVIVTEVTGIAKKSNFVEVWGVW